MFEPTAADARAWGVAATGDPDVDAATWTVVPVAYDSPTPTTGGLYRIIGPTWSVFVKVVQSFRHWDLLDLLPPAMRARALVTTAWRYEADLYRADVGALLPAGMRLPAVYDLRDDGDDRVVVVMEDVDAVDSPWDARRYTDAAQLLGRLDARLTAAPGEPSESSSERTLQLRLPTTELHEPDAMLRQYVESRIAPLFVAPLTDAATWRHPLLAGHAELHVAISELAARIPALLDSLAGFDHVRTHGDAAPHNLLVPRAAPDQLVVIDWAMGACAPAGEELGQLLLGPAHDGDLTGDDLVALRDVVVPAYAAGLTAEGIDVSEGDVRLAMDTAITLRSAFSALPIERLGEPVTDELAALVERRLELTRHLVDVGLALDRASRASRAREPCSSVSAPRGGT